MIHPSYLTLRVAQEQIAERRETASRRRATALLRRRRRASGDAAAQGPRGGAPRRQPRFAVEPASARYDSVAVRSAQPSDDPALARIALLDDKPLPRGRVLVGEADGEVIAAIGNGGLAIAHPFRPTREVVTLLELRSVQLAARRA